MTPPQRRIFLSYGRRDEENFVDKIYRYLKHLNVFVWYDRENLLTRGAEFTDEIARAVEASDLLLLFVGPHATGSEWVRREWLHALKHCIPVIPLIVIGEGEIGAVLAAGDYPRAITAANAIDCRTRETDAGYSAITAKLAQFIHADPLPLATPHGAPALPPHYVERPAYLNAVKAQLSIGDPTRPDRVRIATITAQQETATLQGIGGIGKTTLAQAVVADCDVRRTFDQIFWLEVGPERSAADLLGLFYSIGHTLQPGLHPYGDLNTARQNLSAKLAGQRTLIVLDDVWAEGLIDGFSFSGVDCRVLVTTRNKALVDDFTAVDNLSSAESLALIANLLMITADKLPPACADIVRVLDGHTLAVQIVGGWLKKYGLARADSYLTHLSEEDPFEHLRLSKTDKNKNLGRSLALSYDALDPVAQAQFRAIGIFAAVSTFDLGALAAVWGLSGADAALYPATALADLALLTHDPATDRYSQHPLLRAYARALLRREQEFETAFGRYADDVIGASAAFDELPLERWGELDPLLPHVAEVGDGLAARWAAAAREVWAARCADFASQIASYCLYHPELLLVMRDGSLWPERLAWLEAGIAASARLANPQRQSRLLYIMANVLQNLGRWPEALNCLEACLRLDEQLNDPREIAVTQSKIADLYVQQGRWDEALALYEASLKTIQQLNDPREIAVTQSKIADLYVQQGRWDEALALYEASLKTIQQLNDPRAIAVTQSKIADLYVQQGRWDEALALYEASLKTIQQLNDPREIAVTQSSIADLYVQQGRWDEALALYEASLKTIQQLNDPRAIAVTQSKIADLYVQQGRWDEALALYEASLKTIQQLNDPRAIAVTQSSIADLYVQQGRWDEALALYEASLKTIQQLNDPRAIAVTQSKIADLYVQQGRWDEALALYEASLKTKKQLNDPRAIAVTQSSIADLYVQQGRWDEALALYEASLKTKKQLNDPRAIAVTQSSIADLYVQQGRWDEALALYEASLKTIQQLNDPRAIAVTQINLAQHFMQRGEQLRRVLTLLWSGYQIIERLGNPREIPVVRQILAHYRDQVGMATFDVWWREEVGGLLPAWLTAQSDIRPGQNTLPAQTVQQLAGNTFAVMTTAAAQRDEWRTALTGLRDDFAGRGAEWGIEVAFAEALLAVLDGGSPSLPDDNPYAGVVRQVVAAIQDGGDGEG